MSSNHGDEIIHRVLDSDRENPAVEVAEIVAELEEEAIAELATTEDCLDDVLGEIISSPPSPEAQVEVTFSDEGSRITVVQNGNATFIKTD